MRNASYVTACCEHSCEQKIVYIERYERMHIETTTEHITGNERAHRDDKQARRCAEEATWRRRVTIESNQ